MRASASRTCSLLVMSIALLASLLTLPALAASTHSADQVAAQTEHSKPKPPPKKHKHKKPKLKKSRVTVRLTPPAVTLGEESGLVATVSPVRPIRTLTIQKQVGANWVVVGRAKSDTKGSYYLPLKPTATTTYRVKVARYQKYAKADSAPIRLSVYGAGTCASTPLVDPAATSQARCIGAKLDRWKAAGLMGVGQQLNLATGDANPSAPRARSFMAPLTALGARPEFNPVSVVGFDLEELRLAVSYGFGDQVLKELFRMAAQGVILTASWHPRNPSLDPTLIGTSENKSWGNVAALLSGAATSPEKTKFLAQYDEVLGLLLRLQNGDLDGDGVADPGQTPAAVVFRPLHEGNGNWFWWGQGADNGAADLRVPNPAAFRQLYGQLQDRAAAHGVHNVVWAFSANWDPGPEVLTPSDILPARLDLGGIDAYDDEEGAYPTRPELASYHRPDRLVTTGWTSIASTLDRMVLMETGPHGSTNGNWNPVTITNEVRTYANKPLWAMFWFDDGTPTVESPKAGKKQLSSLVGGAAWLKSCHNELCYVR